MRSTRLTVLLAVSSLTCGVAALASPDGQTCEPRVLEALSRAESKRAGKRVLLRDEAAGGGLISVACKVWPRQPSKLLAAFAQNTAAADEKSEVVAVLDAKSLRVEQRHERRIQEDAVYQVEPGNLRFDTANYRLSNAVLAFGVIHAINPRMPGAVESWWGGESALYVREGHELRPVLELARYQVRWLVGCSGCWRPNDHAEEAEITLAMASTQTNGFSDIWLTARITTSIGRSDDPKHKPRTERLRLAYNGKTYRPVAAEAPWWVGWSFN